MREIRQAFKFRLRPTKAQQRFLIQWMNTTRYVYNACLEHRKLCYENFRKSISYYDQQNELPAIKKETEFLWMNEVPSQSLQMAIRQVDIAYKNFFNGTAEYPKIKKKHKTTDSVSFPEGKSIKIKKDIKKKATVLGIPKIKKGIKIVYHREIQGEIKQYTISHKSGEWYISFSCIVQKQNKPIPNIPIGIDLGIVKTIALSDKREKNINIALIKQIEKKKEKIQQKKSREVKFSEKWKYYNKIEQKLYKKIVRIRQDFIHKLTTNLSKNHAIICMEDLKIKKMSDSNKGTIAKPGKNVKQKSKLNRSILSQGWGSFKTILKYKTEWNDSILVLVDPKNTSRRCYKCGHTTISNRKTQELFCCIKCGYTENADYNAAKNILRLGLQSLGLENIEALSIIASA